MADGAVSEVLDINQDVQMKSHDNQPDLSIFSSPTIDESTDYTLNGTIPTAEINKRGRKRKFVDSSPGKRARQVSPPWKKVIVDGPTSFIEDGRRKSSRTNTVPLELQAPGKTRQTRAGHLRQTETKLRKVQNASPTTINKHANLEEKDSRRLPRLHDMQQGGHNNILKVKQRQIEGQHALINGSTDSLLHRPITKTLLYSNEEATVVEDLESQHRKWRRRRSPIPNTPIHGDIPVVASSLLPASSPASPYKPIKSLRLNYRPPPLPIYHPGNVPRPRRFSSLKALFVHHDNLDGDREHPLSDQEAREEALLLLKLENATTSNGLLRSDLWGADAADTLNVTKPPVKSSSEVSHADYLRMHAVDFQHRLQIVRENHRAWVKKWVQLPEVTLIREGPRVEDPKDAARDLYSTLMRELQNKWATAHNFAVNQRVAQETAAIEAKTKDELNRMLDASTTNLKMRLAHNSEGLSSQESDISGTDLERENANSSGTDSDNDVEDSSDAETVSSGSISTTADDTLTQEALREKYRDLYALGSAENVAQSSMRKHPHSIVRAMIMPASPSYSTYGGLEEKLSTTSNNLDRTDQYSKHETMPNTDESDVYHDSVQTLDSMLPALEEVDDILLDDTDDEDDADEDEDEDEDEDDNEDDEDEHEIDDGVEMLDNDSEDENDSEAEDIPGEGFGLLGFFSHQQQRSLIEAIPEPQNQDSRTDKQFDAQLQPEILAEYHQDVVSAGSLPLVEHARVQLNTAFPASTHGAIEHLTPGFNSSDEASRQLSPSTTNTGKPSESDSMTSVEAFEESDAVSVKDITAPENFKTEVSPLLRGQLRVYQHAGLDWLVGMYASQANGILADEMGLGKTIQTIALLAHLATEQHIWGPHLIVVPTSVMLNWEMEFKKWCPGFKILTYYGNIDERKEKRRGWSDNNLWNVCITSYNLAIQDALVLKRRDWHYLILDEAHNIKNFQSQRWQTLISFKSEARLLLTGTPLQNNLTELWSLLFFLEPDRDERGGFKFSDLATFSRTFRKPVDLILEHGREDLDDEARELVVKLHKVLRPHLLRRLKADVEKQMPKKYEHVVKCRLSKRQRQLYDGYMGLADTRDSFQSGNYMSIINCLMQLRKVCNHPDLFETRQIVTSYAMPKSAVVDFEIKELLIRKRLNDSGILDLASDRALNLWHPDRLSGSEREQSLAALQQLSQGIADQDAKLQANLIPSGHGSIVSAMEALDFKQQTARLSELQCQYMLTAIRTQRRPLYGVRLLKHLTIVKPLLQIAQASPQSALMESSITVPSLVTTISERAEMMKPVLQKFGCVTPSVVAPDVARLSLTRTGMDVVRRLEDNSTEDSFHEARTRLAIAFPDKGLVQYDCGKLQQLDRLLRNLQVGGHRALIFTQMTKVLDILEQFLNLHGHRYLRLDGTTKVEHRQMLTERFNNDTRIPVFILSTRSGGIGINLTGADTVIFYDLDWNPAMDKQCQDRCHRIGQTRDVHIYRFVSEGTIEANILRKSDQKRMLDDVVIQEGDFTTDYFNRLDPQEFLVDHADVDAAVDKVFGGAGNGRMFDQAEDVEDRRAAEEAQKEYTHMDDGDFEDTKTGSAGIGTPKPDTVTAATPGAGTAQTPSFAGAAASSPVVGPEPPMHDVEMTNAGVDEEQDRAEEEEVGSWEEYMLRHKQWELRKMVVKLPGAERVNKRKAKKGQAGTMRIRR